MKNIILTWHNITGIYLFIITVSYFCTFSASSLAGESSVNAPMIIILSPDGSDTNNGQTLDTPIKTLSRAHDIIRNKLSGTGTHRNVEIRIAPGIYREQKVKWTFTMPEHEINFMPLFDNKERPIFDGVHKRGTWFSLYHEKGQRTNLHFRYIYVKNYATALSFNGKRNHKYTYNEANRIYGCVFKNIGEGSTAALRFFNSRNNEIINNHFINILSTSSCDSLHAIYAAHMSSNNKILRNRFHNCCGDPVRIRDFSNNNQITDNIFIRTGITAAYTDWYCDHDARNDCTKPAAECPSWDNHFYNNILRGNYVGAKLKVVKLFQDNFTTGCIKPSSTSQRIFTRNSNLTF